MNRKVIANWKMHFSLKEAINFCTILSLGTRLKASSEGGADLIIAAPAPYLAHLIHLFPHLIFAAQDVSARSLYGAYTGEVSAEQLRSCGVQYCIVGHRECRHNFSEDDEIVKRKADNCLKANIIPIVCLGDDPAFAKALDEGCMIAYEPKESIGTGLVPDSERLKEVFGELKSMVAKSVNLIYGGSVNSANILDIKLSGNIDSILLGGASLRVDELNKILKIW